MLKHRLYSALVQDYQLFLVFFDLAGIDVWSIVLGAEQADAAGNEVSMAMITFSDAS